MSFKISDKDSFGLETWKMEIFGTMSYYHRLPDAEKSWLSMIRGISERMLGLSKELRKPDEG